MALLRRNKQKASNVVEPDEEIKKVQSVQTENNEQPKEPENKPQENQNEAPKSETKPKVSRRAQSLQDFLY